VAGWIVLLGDEYERLGKHIAAGSIYISNFVLQSESGYFDTEADLKPLLHLWSLAIEEQFYLVFPLLLIAGKRFQISPLFIISTSLVISFLANVIQIQDKPTEVFFFPYSRAWELLVGSLVAYLSIHSIAKNQAEKFANPLSWLGVVLILSAWILLNSKKILFPSWWALMPTLGAAFLIFSGQNAWFNRKILASRIAIFIGLISYPLYLWHWVFLSFIHITEIEKPKPFLKIALLLLSLFLAWLTYLFVEKKLRFQKSKFISLGLLTSLLLIGSVGYFIEFKKGFPLHHSIEVNWTEGELGNDVLMKQNLFTQTSCVDKYQNFFKKRNESKELLEYKFCLLENSEKPPTALLFGDSHANHLYAGLANNSALTGGNLLNLGLGGCYPFVNLFFQEKNCQHLIREGLNMAIAEPSIKTVILTSRTFSQKGIIEIKKSFGSDEGMPREDFYNLLKDSMKKSLEMLLLANKKIIFILDTPTLDFSPEACIARPWRLTGQSFKTPCAVTRLNVDSARQKYLESIMSVLKSFPIVKVLDPLPAFCDKDYCWAIKDKKMLYRDTGHLSKVGAVYLGEYFERQINGNDKTHGN
jgi:peptidoglycan/LPS O-acetylase OafA/YrhL